MRWTPLLCGVVVLGVACGDDTQETAEGSASESAGSSGLNPSAPTSSTGPGVTDSASASDSDSGSASMSSATVPTTGETSTGGPSTGDDSLSASGTTTGTAETTTTTTTTTGPDTGGEFCSVPDVPVEDVPLNDACVIAQQNGTFTPVVEWKYGTTPFCGPAVAGQTIDTNMSGKIDSKDLPLVFQALREEMVLSQRKMVIMTRLKLLTRLAVVCLLYALVLQ